MSAIHMLDLAPLTVTLDVETTGLDPVSDRIIELALDFSKGKERTEGPVVLRFNPGRPIPPESTAVHGITDEDVAECNHFSIMASALYESLSRVKIIRGYNVGFDLTFLAEEFTRCGIVWPVPGTIVLDGMKIWQQQQPRTLENACRAYGIEPDPNRLHTADYDVEMTSSLIDRQLAQAQNIEEMIAATNGILLDPAGKISLSPEGEAVYTFGKHMGQSVLSQRGYARWMLDSDFPECTKNVLRGLFTDPDYLKNLDIIITPKENAHADGIA